MNIKYGMESFRKLSNVCIIFAERFTILSSRLSLISTYLGLNFAGNIGSVRFFRAIVWLFVTLLPRFALAFLKRFNLASAWDNFLITLCFGSLSGTSTMKSSGNSSLSRSFLTRCFRVSSYSIRWSFAIIRFLSIVSWSTSSTRVCLNEISSEWKFCLNGMIKI